MTRVSKFRAVILNETKVFFTLQRQEKINVRNNADMSDIFFFYFLKNASQYYCSIVV